MDWKSKKNKNKKCQNCIGSKSQQSLIEFYSIDLKNNEEIPLIHPSSRRSIPFPFVYSLRLFPSSRTQTADTRSQVPWEIWLIDPDYWGKMVVGKLPHCPYVKTKTNSPLPALFSLVFSSFFPLPLSVTLNFKKQSTPIHHH